MTAAAFLAIDLPAGLLALLASVTCALLGNFLVLRRQAMMGDAVTHVVLPGIVIGYLIAGGHAPLWMTAGALVATLASVAMIELLQRHGGLEKGAALGTVFTVMFALGLVLIERTGHANAHISPDHVLFGNLESAIWVGPATWADLYDPAQYAALPAELVTLLVVAPAIFALVALFFKELAIATFDPLLADSLGFSDSAIGYGFVTAVAVAAVASFEAVGSILVVAMFICPAAAARLLTDRLKTQLVLSVALAAVSAVGGYALAAAAPAWAGTAGALNAAGMIAVLAGLIELAAILFAPRYGILPTRLRTARAR